MKLVSVESPDSEGEEEQSEAQHVMPYGIAVAWRALTTLAAVPDSNTAAGAYIEVASPLNQNRPNGDPARPWSETEPRYAWSVDGNNVFHIAGWSWDKDREQWFIADFYTPWTNVIHLRVFKHEDWEGKPHDDNANNA